MSAMKIRAKALKELEDKFGRVTAEKLFEAAKDRKHPLHNDFIWDKNKAWREHNLDIAREIIASIRVVTKDTSRTYASVSYVRDPNAGPREQGYVSIVRLRNEREAAEEALLAETSRLQSQLERCKEIAEVLDLKPELDAVLQSVMRLSSRLRRGPSTITEDRASV